MSTSTTVNLSQPFGLNLRCMQRSNEFDELRKRFDFSSQMFPFTYKYDLRNRRSAERSINPHIRLGYAPLSKQQID